MCFQAHILKQLNVKLWGIKTEQADCESKVWNDNNL